MTYPLNDGAITSFRGQYAYLSNFYPAKFLFRGDLALSAEHHFQAAKAVLEDDRLRIFDSSNFWRS